MTAMKEAGKAFDITEENFEDTVTNGIVLLDWWASWCAPCRAFAPTFSAAAARHPDVAFGKVNTEEEPALAQAFAIRSIPTLMLFRDGVLLFAQPGMVPAAALDELIAQAKKLDMDAVKKEIARPADATTKEAFVDQRASSRR